MKKLAIPAILTATVMVAGLFAFAPVEQASTIHATEILPALESSTLVRSQTFLNFVTGGTGFSGTVTYSLTGDAEGAFEIEKMFLCGLATDRIGNPRMAFTTETSIIGTGGTGSLRDGGGEKFDQRFNYMTGDSCVDVLAVDSEDYHLLLGGDENNDIIVHLIDGNLSGAETDGGTLVAYIVGLSDSDDLEIVTDLS